MTTNADHVELEGLLRLRYAEIEELKAEVKRLRTETQVQGREQDELLREIERLRAENDHLNAENEKAWNEIERLTAAMREIAAYGPGSRQASIAIAALEGKK